MEQLLIVAVVLAVLALSLRDPGMDVDHKPVAEAAGSAHPIHLDAKHDFGPVPVPFEPMRDNEPWSHHWDEAPEDIWWA